MRVREQMEVIIDHYPYHESINQKLLEELKFLHFTTEIYNGDGGKTAVKADQTSNDVVTPTISLIKEWIVNLMMVNRNFNSRIDDCWAARYDKGDYTVSHNHYTCIFAFVYFIKCPRGSSPLVFTTSRKKIKAEEGKVVIFPGYLYHQVPKNQCDGRIVLAGNLLNNRGK